jgi:plastocyanin
MTRIVLAFLAAAVLIGLSASIAPPASAQQAQQSADVRVTLSNFDFGPALVRVPVRQRVTLTLVNSSKGGHDFAAGEFFRAARVDPADAAKIDNGTVEVPGHGNVTIGLTIDRPGRYKLKCTHFLHATFGMKGEIVAE